MIDYWQQDITAAECASCHCLAEESDLVYDDKHDAFVCGYCKEEMMEA